MWGIWHVDVYANGDADEAAQIMARCRYVHDGNRIADAIWELDVPAVDGASAVKAVQDELRAIDRRADDLFTVGLRPD